MRTTYLTVARTAEAEIEVKRSRFRCRVERVGSEEAARAVVERVRRQDWDARHQSDLRARDAVVLGADYAEQATLHLAVPAGGDDRLQALLSELTGGTAVPRFTGESWTDA